MLAIDTSSPQGSICIIDFIDGSPKVVNEVTWTRGKSHSELVTPSLVTCLTNAKLTIHELKSVAVGPGPGSFTGIRVGVNVARAIGYATQIPVFSTNSLRLLAQPALNSEMPVLCMVNAFKNMLYVAMYHRTSGTVKELCPVSALRPQEIENQMDQSVIVVGDGLITFSDSFSAKSQNFFKTSTYVYPQASDFVGLFQSDGALIGDNSWISVKPLYIRGSEAEEKLRSGLLKQLPKL